MPANVTFRFTDRDFMTASPGVYAILCSCKERLCQERTPRGFRREVRFIMSPPGKRRHNELNAAPPSETPGERARREKQPTETTFTAEKVSVFGAKIVCSASRAARFRRADFGFLSEGVSPGERVRPVTAATEMLQAAENVALFGQKPFDRRLPARKN